MKIIAYVILSCILLNLSFYSITINKKIDLSIVFSHVGSTITYSYNPIQLTKELQDSLLGHLSNVTDKQNEKKNEKNTGREKKNNPINFSFSNYKIQTIEKFSSPAYEKLIAKNRLLTDNLSVDFLYNNAAIFAFYCMLMMWLAIIFRKKRNLLKDMKFIKKHIIL